jgi:hypothetical protein
MENANFSQEVVPKTPNASCAGAVRGLCPARYTLERHHYTVDVLLAMYITPAVWILLRNFVVGVRARPFPVVWFSPG